MMLSFHYLNMLMFVDTRLQEWGDEGNNFAMLTIILDDTLVNTYEGETALSNISRVNLRFGNVDFDKVNMYKISLPVASIIDDIRRKLVK